MQSNFSTCRKLESQKTTTSSPMRPRLVKLMCFHSRIFLQKAFTCSQVPDSFYFSTQRNAKQKFNLNTVLASTLQNAEFISTFFFYILQQMFNLSKSIFCNVFYNTTLLFVSVPTRYVNSSIYSFFSLSDLLLL